MPLNINGYQPENFDSKFSGSVTVEYALENSLNVPAVKSLNELGTDKMIAKLVACNFKQIKRDEKKLGLSLILGGCGVTLEEMTALYSSFANGGIYAEPNFISTGDTKHQPYNFYCNQYSMHRACRNWFLFSRQCAECANSVPNCWANRAAPIVREFR